MTSLESQSAPARSVRAGLSRHRATAWYVQVRRAVCDPDNRPNVATLAMATGFRSACRRREVAVSDLVMHLERAAVGHVRMRPTPRLIVIVRPADADGANRPPAPRVVALRAVEVGPHREQVVTAEVMIDLGHDVGRVDRRGRSGGDGRSPKAGSRDALMVLTLASVMVVTPDCSSFRCSTLIKKKVRSRAIGPPALAPHRFWCTGRRVPVSVLLAFHASSRKNP